MDTPEEPTIPHPISGIIMINSYKKNIHYAGKDFAQSIKEIFNIDIPPTEAIVDVIIVNKKTEDTPLNYATHWAAVKNPLLQKRLPSWLPISMIDTKEGDIIRLTAWGKTIELTCQQQCFELPNNFETEIENFKKRCNQIM
jgi:hypothetical protein